MCAYVTVCVYVCLCVMIMLHLLYIPEHTLAIVSINSSCYFSRIYKIQHNSMFIQANINSIYIEIYFDEYTYSITI